LRFFEQDALFASVAHYLPVGTLLVDEVVSHLVFVQDLAALQRTRQLLFGTLLLLVVYKFGVE
jgi:hypothetical protein